MGDFESWEALAPTLTPLLKEEIAGRYLPWAIANGDAMAKGADSFEVEIGGAEFSQTPQKYHARSLATIRAKARAALEAAPELAEVLRQADCLEGLTG